MAEAQSSAEVLAKIWQDFAKNAERETGLPVRKSATSRHYLNGDDRLLTRWLNPGAHKNWRIPLSRIPEVCRELNASSQMMDELMLAKFGETSEDDPQHPVLVATWWAFESCERHHHGLSQDERQILTLYREQAQRFPRGLNGTSDESVQLSQLFGSLLKEAQRDQEEEARGNELDTSSMLEVKRRAKVVAESLEKSAIAAAGGRRKAAYASKKSFALQVRDYFKGLQRKWP